MKIVCIGDTLLTAEMMRQGVEKFPRYTAAEYFTIGPSVRDELRTFVKKMETQGFDFIPLGEEVYTALNDAEVLQVHLAPVPARVFREAKELKLIISNRGGIENIDIKTATERNIPVLCNPAHNANAVAEMTIGLMIAETRNIARNHLSLMCDRKWYEFPPNAGRIHEMCSMTVGIVGYGMIGILVAALLAPFRCRVLVYDPYVTQDMAVGNNVALVPVLEELLEQSDIVSLHARVSEETRGMIGEAQLAKMKKTAVLINTARSALIDMDALYCTLKERGITGAAIDVFPTEPLPADSPLLELDNITLTCHKGGDTVESYCDSPAMVLEQGENYFQNKPVRFWVNRFS
ncbi:MAG: 2-hydroxyacid dehydrogenase [Treponema sp.]|jgi:D-3-phosphoglycerate dehydrogenase|nr:2-hydroxyacid dehydrogenase [Treponema sp.]